MMPPDVPRLSLIVCTRNRAERLGQFLARLTRLSAPHGGWELILVDNASNDATPGIIHSFAESAPFATRCVRAPVPGLARARNAGLAVARGQLLAFTDDDCYPEPDYLVRVAEAFDDGHPGFIGGRVLLHDATDARITVRDQQTRREIPARTFVRAGLIHGANMAVSRDVVRDIGGFDPLLGAGTTCIAGEDTDYVARAVWAGWSGRYDPGPTVAHHHGRKPGPEAVRQAAGYDYGRGAYYLKFVRRPDSRRTYARHWLRSAWRDLLRGNGARPWREAVGAARYLLMILSQREIAPRFTETSSPRTPPAR